MSQALTIHDKLIESLARQHNGFIVRPRGEGDSRFLVFTRAIDGIIAAAAIQKALHAEAWPSPTPLYVRMGIHTGEGEYRDGDYYGTAVNRCARLRGVAHGGQTLISQTSYNLTIDILPEGLKFLDLGEHPLKGLKRPDNIFQLIAAGLPTKFPPLILSDQDEKQPIQLPAFLAEGHEIEVQEAVFVGRDLELERLNKYLEDALHGQGNVAFISGGPGRGKTSLIEAFIRHSTQTHSNLLVCFGNCNAHSGVGDGYLPFRQVLDMLAGDVEAHWSSGKLSGEQAQRLWENVPNTLRCITELGPDLIDVFVPGEKLLNWSQSYAPKDNLLGSELEKLVYQKTHFGNPTEVNQVNLFEQYSRALLAISKQQPVLVVLDDLQWADTASTSLLFYLGRIVKDGQMLILGAYRPDEVAFGRGGERHPLEKVLHELHRIYGDIDVDLTQEGRGREFIDKLLDSEPNKHSANFRQSLFNHTGGHPLFTLELLRSMQERGVLGLNNQGYWEEQAPINWNSLPVRVEAVIEERISRLEDELLETLTIASVEGEDFTAQVVAQIQEVKERQLLKALSRELDKKHRLVQELGEWKVTGHFLQRYRFAHQLFQRYLYNNLSSGERRLLHNEIANILEDFYAGSADLYAIQLSYHYLRAGITDKALDYLIKAGQQAKEKYANEEAIGFFNSANDQLLILLSEETSQSDIWAPTTILIHENMADVLAMIGQYDKAKEAYQKALDQVPENEFIQRAYLLKKVGSIWQIQRSYDDALKTYEEAESYLGKNPAISTP